MAMEKKNTSARMNPAEREMGFQPLSFFVSFESCASEIPPHKREGNMFIQGKSLYKILLFVK